MLVVRVETLIQASYNLRNRKLTSNTRPLVQSISSHAYYKSVSISDDWSSVELLELLRLGVRLALNQLVQEIAVGQSVVAAAAPHALFNRLALLFGSRQLVAGEADGLDALDERVHGPHAGGHGVHLVAQAAHRVRSTDESIAHLDSSSAIKVVGAFVVEDLHHILAELVVLSTIGVFQNLEYHELVVEGQFKRLFHLLQSPDGAALVSAERGGEVALCRGEAGLVLGARDVDASLPVGVLVQLEANLELLALDTEDAGPVVLVHLRRDLEHRAGRIPALHRPDFDAVVGHVVEFPFQLAPVSADPNFLRALRDDGEGCVVHVLALLVVQPGGHVDPVPVALHVGHLELAGQLHAVALAALEASKEAAVVPLACQVAGLCKADAQHQTRGNKCLPHDAAFV